MAEPPAVQTESLSSPRCFPLCKSFGRLPQPFALLILLHLVDLKLIPALHLNPFPLSLRSWRDFACECFCFGSDAVNTSGEAVRGFSPLANFLAGFAREDGGSAARSPAHESRQLRRLISTRDLHFCLLLISSHHKNFLSNDFISPGQRTENHYYAPNIIFVLAVSPENCYTLKRPLRDLSCKSNIYIGA